MDEKRFFDAAAKIGLSADEAADVRGSLLRFSASRPVRAGAEECLSDRMHDSEQTFLRAARGIRLGTADVRDVRTTVLRYAKEHPVGRHAARGFWSLFSGRLIAVCSCFLVIFAGTGAAYASSSALPGDTLYPVKVTIAEPIAGLFVPAQKQAQWQTALVERRLEEAEEVIARGSVDLKAQAHIRRYLRTQLEDVQRSIVSLDKHGKSDDAVALQSFVEGTLDGHEAVVEALVFTGSGSGTEEEEGVSTVLIDMKEARRSIASIVLKRNKVGDSAMIQASSSMSSDDRDDEDDDHDRQKRKYEHASQVLESLENKMKSKKGLNDEMRAKMQAKFEKARQHWQWDDRDDEDNQSSSSDASATVSSSAALSSGASSSNSNGGTWRSRGKQETKVRVNVNGEAKEKEETREWDNQGNEGDDKKDGSTSQTTSVHVESNGDGDQSVRVESHSKTEVHLSFP